MGEKISQGCRRRGRTERGKGALGRRVRATRCRREEGEDEAGGESGQPMVLDHCWSDSEWSLVSEETASKRSRKMARARERESDWRRKGRREGSSRRVRKKEIKKTREGGREGGRKVKECEEKDC